MKGKFFCQTLSKAIMSDLLKVVMGNKELSGKFENKVCDGSEFSFELEGEKYSLDIDQIRSRKTDKGVEFELVAKSAEEVLKKPAKKAKKKTKKSTKKKED